MYDNKLQQASYIIFLRQQLFKGELIDFSVDHTSNIFLAAAMQPVPTCTQFKAISSLVALVDHACTKGFLFNESALKIIA